MPIRLSPLNASGRPQNEIMYHRILSLDRFPSTPLTNFRGAFTTHTIRPCVRVTAVVPNRPVHSHGHRLDRMAGADLDGHVRSDPGTTVRRGVVSEFADAAG